MVTKVEPKSIMAGDTIVVTNEAVTVKYIDGPDRIGTYEFGVIDKSGNSHIEIVTEPVTLIM